jgi:hypothetical protein
MSPRNRGKRGQRPNTPRYSTMTYAFFSTLAVTTTPSVVDISCGEINIDNKRSYKVLEIDLEYSSPNGSSSTIYLNLNGPSGVAATSRHHNVTVNARNIKLRMPYTVPFTTSAANFQVATLVVTGSTNNVTVVVSGVVRVGYMPQINLSPVQLSSSCMLISTHHDQHLENPEQAMLSHISSCESVLELVQVSSPLH